MVARKNTPAAIAEGSGPVWLRSQIRIGTLAILSRVRTLGAVSSTPISTRAGLCFDNKAIGWMAQFFRCEGGRLRGQSGVMRVTLLRKVGRAAVAPRGRGAIPPLRSG